MSLSHTYAGQFEMNGKLVSDRVRMSYSQGYRAHFANGNSDRFAGDELTLHPFTERMLLPETCEDVRPGRRFNVNGTHLGEIRSGPKGHPADGEFDIRCVTSFALTAEYTKRVLTIGIGGTTSPGTSVCYFAQTVEATGLKPWRFRVVLQVPRDVMHECFEYDSTSREWIDELLDGRAAHWEPPYSDT